MPKMKPAKLFVKTLSTRGKGSTKKYHISVDRGVDRPLSTAGRKQFDDHSNSISGDESEQERLRLGTLGACFEAERDEESLMSAHDIRKVKEAKGWDKLRYQMYRSSVEEEAIPEGKMCVCCTEEGVHTLRPATCRCLECGPRQYFCSICALKLHSTRNAYHVLEICQAGHFKPMFLSDGELANECNKPGCNFFYRNFVVIDYRGRQHIKKVRLCNCREEASQLLKLGLWPASSKRPTVAFHMHFMEMATMFLLESQVSLFKFCNTMELLSSKLLPKKIKSIYQVLNSKCFEEYRFYKRSLENVSKDSSSFEAEECILCPKHGESGVIIESMDGCFGLTRKRSAGKSFDLPLHGEVLFADQDDVDNYVESCSLAVEGENECHEFKSGEVTDSLRSKGKNKHFDLKGVFGRVCRHGVPKGFINLKHGERIAYAVYELKRIYAKYQNENLSLLITYDIACKLKSHLKANGCSILLNAFKFAIPVMHCYGHKMACQLLYNPRRLKGFGLTDGEAIERLWSYLRPYSSMTKEMTPTHRTNLLTDALLHVTWRKNNAAGIELSRKLKNCAVTRKKTSSEICKLEQEINVTCTADIIALWQREEEEAILRPANSIATQLSNWQDDYAKKILCLNQLRNQLAYLDVVNGGEDVQRVLTKIKRIDRQLKSVEQKKNIKRRWKCGDAKLANIIERIAKDQQKAALENMRRFAVERLFLCSLKNKYADGQAIAIRISSQINRASNCLKKSITKYNAELSCWEAYSRMLPKAICFNDVKEPTAEIYKEINSERLDLHDDIPVNIKQALVRLNLLICRCDEEEDMLREETVRLSNDLHRSLDFCHSEASQIQFSDDVFHRGLRTKLLRKALEIQFQIYENRQLFSEMGIELEIANEECFVVHRSSFEDNAEENIEGCCAESDCDVSFVASDSVCSTDVDSFLSESDDNWE